MAPQALSAASILVFVVLALVGYATAGTGLFQPVFVFLSIDFAVMLYALYTTGEPDRE